MRVSKIQRREHLCVCGRITSVLRHLFPQYLLNGAVRHKGLAAWGEIRQDGLN